jgi:hypothetical protein
MPPYVQPAYEQTDAISPVVGHWHRRQALCHVHFQTRACDDCQIVLRKFKISLTHSTRRGYPGPMDRRGL